MWSIIVFSDRCVLKDITIRSNNVSVTNHSSVASAIAKICNQMQTDAYTEMEVNDIYNKIYPYTQLDSRVKEQYVEQIIKEKNFSSSQF